MKLVAATPKPRTNPARQAAKDYIEGATLRAEAEQLTDRMLARKFECAPSTIKRTKAHAQVTALTEDEQELVRQCAREHDRLMAQHRFLTKPYLSNEYGVPICAINAELDRMGFKNPLNRKSKDRRTAA